MTRQERKNREADVDEQVGAAAGDDVDAYGWDCEVRCVSGIFG